MTQLNVMVNYMVEEVTNRNFSNKEELIQEITTIQSTVKNEVELLDTVSNSKVLASEILVEGETPFKLFFKEVFPKLNVLAFK